MNCVIKRKYWEKIYGCFILMKYVNKILVEEKCYSCEEKNHEQNKTMHINGTVMAQKC